MSLHLQKYLREFGLEKTILDLKLIHKYKDNLHLFKYNQIESDYALQAVQEARGLILDANDNWNIVCYTFQKFFNHGEVFAHPINWKTAKKYQKLDGSIIQLYNYNNDWHIATSGTIDADTESNNGLITFQKIFWKTIDVQYHLTPKQFIDRFDPNYCYAFELCTPFNVVVTQHQQYQIYFLGLRHKFTLLEEPIEQEKYDWLLKPAVYNFFNNLEEIIQSFPGKDWQDEGYVVCDANFNRLKVKNPAYVAIHHLKNKLGAHHIMQIVKDNEISEFCIYYPERKQEIEMLSEKYWLLQETLSDQFFSLKYQLKFSQKDFALDVMEKIKPEFRGLMFGLRRRLYQSINQWLSQQDNKFLYLYLTN